MQHTFVKSAIGALCAKCHRSVMAHTKFATCESCSNKGECDVIDNILMCSECLVRHNSTELASARPEALVSSDSVNHGTIQSIEQINSFAESSTIKNITDDAIHGNIQKYTDFFNANIPSLVELESRINQDASVTDKHFELVNICSQRIKHLAKCLFDTRSLEIELSAEVKSIQQYVNNLIPKLRVEQRAQFANSDINYTPPVIKKPSAPKVRLSAEDKIAKAYSEMMKIPLEQAKRLLANKLRSDCTCAVTPGICVVHN